MKPSVESPESAAFLERLRRAVERLDGGDAPRFAVAFSGGVDSTVLLNAMRRLVPAERLRALHIDHAAHLESASWAEHCRLAGAKLGVAYAARRVEVRGGGRGFEAEARDARYAALGELLERGETLLTAHHGDDQLETVLLRLLRGAGVRGLTAIRGFAPLGRGFLARPLLELTRAEIAAQAARWHLTWIEDPANRELHYDRSFLRARVLPALRERWPTAQRSAAGLARRMAEAEQLLEEIARQDAAGLTDPARVPCSALRAHGAARQHNLLRYLIRSLDLPMAGAVHLDQLRAAIATWNPESAAHVSWPGADARLYRDHLYLMATLPAARTPNRPARLTADSAWQADQGCLRVAPAEGLGFPDAWVRAGIEVRLRAGGERFTPLHHAHSKSLKHWFQENGVVPWMRDRIPLLYRDGALIGIADLWIGDEVRRAASDGPRWRAVWTDHPPVH
jgi:tRNA(Ile)-lysidine synthase